MPLLSIAENIFLGHETAKHGVINWFEAFARTKELLNKVGLKEHPNTLITNIGTGKQQLVEIAKALNKKVKLLILDEPTSSLNETDSNALLALLKEFKAQGISSILITHKLNEVLKVADRITVLRDGMTVDTLDTRTAKVSEDRIIKAMVGRELTDRFPPRHAKIGEPIFEVKNWNVYHPLHADRQMIKNVDLMVRKGEVVGIAGLMGAGRTELAMSIFGRAYGQKITGEVLIHGKPADVSTIPKAMEAGLAYVTEDRKTYGLVLIDHIKHNVTLANLEGVSNACVIDELQRTHGRQQVPQGPRHPLFRRVPDDGQPVGRQPAESGAVEMAVLRAGRADSRRADARHRCRRQIRNLRHHQPAGRGGQGGHRHLLGNAGTARHLRPHLCDERRPLRGRNAGQRGHAGKDHAGHHEIMGRLT